MGIMSVKLMQISKTSFQIIVMKIDLFMNKIMSVKLMQINKTSFPTIVMKIVIYE